MIEYNRKNGYYKFYNKDGYKCRIKCDNIEDEKVVVSFIKNLGEVNYHIPNKKFKNTIEVIHFILKNLENNNIIFKIDKLQKLKD